MNGEFEKKLAEQNLRALPLEWRTEVLREARIAAVQPSEVATGWRSWLWPAPRAWAVLAACWVVLLAINALNHPGVPVTTARADAIALATVLTENRRALQDLDIVMVANHAVPAAPHLLPGVSGWIREEKGAMPC